MGYVERPQLHLLWICSHRSILPSTTRAGSTALFSKLFPESQMLIMDDGATFPSWYHLWQGVEFRHSEGLVTAADLYFPTQRVAVFCDGGHHSRGKQKARDAAINAKLEAIG